MSVTMKLFGVGVVVGSDPCGLVVVGVSWRSILGAELEGVSIGGP